MAEPPVAVTPTGIRAGDRATSEALCARRGAAVVGYCQQIAAPGEAVAAAAESFARFRVAVIATPDSDGVDPDILLLSATRHAAARHAPRPALAKVVAQLGGGCRGPQTCALVPELLAARAEDALSDADRLRLSRHVQGCQTCEAAQRRFSAAEATYHNPPDAPPDATTTAAIVGALSPASPRGQTAVAEPVPADAGQRLAAALATPISASPSTRIRDTRPGEPEAADPGPDWPDDSRSVTAARLARVAAAPVAAATARPDGPAPPAPLDPPVGPPGTAVHADDDFGEEVVALESLLDLDEDWGEPAHGPARLPPPPTRHLSDRGDSPELDDDSLEPGQTRRRPWWVLLTPFVVVLAAIFLAVAIAGVLHHSSGHTGTARVIPRPAAVATPVPAANAVRHRAVHHHRRHHHVAATNPTGTSASALSVSPRPSDVVAGATAPSASRPAASPVTPAPSTPASPTPTPAVAAPAPPATSPPATSVQSGGSSTAAPPASGGAPATGAPSTFQATGG